jgi:hypothetical protein
VAPRPVAVIPTAEAAVWVHVQVAGRSECHDLWPFSLCVICSPYSCRRTQSTQHYSIGNQ